MSDPSEDTLGRDAALASVSNSILPLAFVSLCSDEETGLEIHQITRPPGFNVERRRSRAVLYQLSGHLQKQDKTKSKLKINNVRGDAQLHTQYRHKSLDIQILRPMEDYTRLVSGR